MTNDDIIRLMQDACDKQKVDPWHDGYCTVTQEELKRFAEMVADAEREACASICDNIRFSGYKPAEDGDADLYYNDAAMECADEIRARGNK